MLALSRWKIIAVLGSLIFGLIFTIPNFLPKSVLDALPGWVPKQQLALGLDLRGGSQLLLEVDTAALKAEKLRNLIEDVRKALQDARIPFSNLTQVGSTVSVNVTDPARSNEAANIIRRNVGGQLTNGAPSTLVALKDGGRLEVTLTDQALNEESIKAVQQSIEIVRRRIDALGTKEPTVLQQGVNRILVQVPGESDPTRLIAVIGKTAKLTFQMVDSTVSPEDIRDNRPPPGTEILPSEDGHSAAYAVRRRALVSGEMLVTAGQGNDSQTGEAVVTFRFNGEGARRFAAATRANVGKPFAIVLDGKIISAPVINGPITGGSGQITGNFTAESANELAILLRAGALPAPLHVEEQRTVSAELGADSVKAGTLSLALGAVAIIVFIIIAYGMFGVYAAIALVVNVLMMVGILNVTQSTLSLPGIAGLILTLAVAVDANVLIYERIRDEARLGRTPMSAVDTGYRRALVSIIDANVTTLISALIMFSMGAGPVRGFALTLMIGVLTSVFTAVIITQLLIGWWFRVAKPKSLPIA